jgi:hypothetical protein
VEPRKSLLIPTGQQRAQLWPELLEVIENGKSGLSLNDIVACPLDCGFCVRHLFDNCGMMVLRAWMSEELAVERLVGHRYFQPHDRPVQVLRTEPLGQLVNRLAGVWTRSRLITEHDSGPPAHAPAQVLLRQVTELCTGYDDLVTDLRRGRRGSRSTNPGQPQRGDVSGGRDTRDCCRHRRRRQRGRTGRPGDRRLVCAPSTTGGTENVSTVLHPGLALRPIR